MKRIKMITKITSLSILTILLGMSCNQTSKKEVSAPQADFYEKVGISDSDSIVPNIVDLKGLYRLQPADKSLSVDIKVDFKEDNNSVWITNINGNVDEIPKKYRVFADALYVTHDLQEFNRIIEEQRKKGKGISADIIEEMISKIPAVDKYRIELTDSDTIKLFGSRVNFDLIRIKVDK